MASPQRNSAAALAHTAVRSARGMFMSEKFSDESTGSPGPLSESTLETVGCCSTFVDFLSEGLVAVVQAIKGRGVTTRMVDMKDFECGGGEDSITSEWSGRHEGYSSEGSEESRDDWFCAERDTHRQFEFLAAAGACSISLSAWSDAIQDVETDGELLDGGLLRNKRSRARSTRAMPIPSCEQDGVGEGARQWGGGGTDGGSVELCVGSPHDVSLLRIKHLRYLGER